MRENIFVHFLNRELYRSFGLQKVVGVNYIFKILMLGCGNILYVPLSSIWESLYVNDLDYDFLYIMYEKRQIEICSDCITVEEFLYRNRLIYGFDIERYRNIYFNAYNKLKVFVPTKIKSEGTTEKLSNKINDWNLNANLMPSDRLILEKNKKTIKLINHERENNAMTISLFQDKLLQKADNFSMARFLSMCYIEDYCQWLNADISTGIGLHKYLDFYDRMSAEYPYYDVFLINFILCKAGVNKEIFVEARYGFWSKIIENRAMFNMEAPYRLINNIIFNSVKYVSHNHSRVSVHEICKFISVQTSTMRIKSIKEHETSKFINALTMNLNKIQQKTNQNVRWKKEFLRLSVEKKDRKRTFNNPFFYRDANINRGNYMKVFIVHGHDNEVKLELKNYIQNTLNLGEPIILAEKASSGLTIIEKFEKYATDASLVFVLLTPDDVYDTGKRARQNVIFEMGYFLGKLGRKSGRVILLYKGTLDIPNDISGLIYIKIDNGVEAAGEEIRREISAII